jgi:putative membrane protein
MPMTPRVLIIAGLAVLAFAWAGPLPHLVPVSFAAHMTLHMSVVGIGVPLVAIGIAASAGHVRFLRDLRMLPLIASLLDLVVVWGWHAPALHHASRSEPLILAVEQMSFAGVTLLIWLVAFTGPALLGALALFFTSMHMTLLGALLGLVQRPSFAGHAHAAMSGLGPLEDQQLGGVIMLAVGGVVYLAGALTLVARVLKRTTP